MSGENGETPPREWANFIHNSRSDKFTADLVEISSVQYIICDPRPTFVVDFEAYSFEREQCNHLAFCNWALLNSPHLLGIIQRTFSNSSPPNREEEREFVNWVTLPPAFERPQKSIVFFDTLWTVIRIPDRWVVVSGVELPYGDLTSLRTSQVPGPPPPRQHVVPSQAGTSNSLAKMNPETRVTASQGAHGSLDAAWPPSRLGTSDHITWIREFDWASTSLGPMNTWSSQLRQTCEMCLTNPDPTTLFWGDDLILIYNEAYVALAKDKHPSMMGGSARLHWKEVWDQYDPLFDQIRIDGKALKQDNSQLFIQRSGYVEEGFFNLIVMPVYDSDGSVVGFYEPVTEVTKQTLSERRMHMLQRMSERTSAATSLTHLWQLLLDALKGHLNCFHFAGLYTMNHGDSTPQRPQYTLEGAVGFEKPTTSFRPFMDIYGPLQDGMIPAIRQAHEKGTAILLSTADGSLSSSILQRLVDAGLDALPRECIVSPLSSSADENVEAFLIIGISPTRPYDEDYQLFVNLLAGQVESTITFVKLFEKEKERLKQQALYESELKFKRFAENAQVGIFSFDPAGNITFCNEAWLEMSGHDRKNTSAMSWQADVHPENGAEIRGYWDKLMNLEGPQTFEVQYKKPWRPKNRDDDVVSLDRTWVVASAYAEVSNEGKLTGILGCCTDISSLKWVDQLQSQRLTEALELKRQQENFLDITSHEMRNPLNAILHCAAELVELLTELSGLVPTDESASVLSGCLEASRTIVYCGRHQKRIIDDVLTLSKLDSNLLSISPVPTRPLEVVDEVLKVFDTELRASSIQTRTELAESYKSLKIESVLVDPHRLTQILINLVANAIKFTKGESMRSLHIVVGAHIEEPASSHSDNGVRYVPSGRLPTDPTGLTEWGTDEVVFLYFSVQDTGPGMSREEADLLFNRFAQGSPRTHTQYGGSGLGLWISRELAELHGGRIGMSSEVGYGSTFDFYVKGRRATSPGILKSPETANGLMLPTKLGPARRIGDGPPALVLTKSSPSVLQNVVPPPSVHVLIVEDNLINQKILAKLMRKQGYTASIANQGHEALDMIRKSTWDTTQIHHNSAASPKKTPPTKFDVVLADIEMPVMDGKEFVQRVRHLQREGALSADIPVIAVTGNARSEQMLAAKDCGFDDVVSKPYRVEDLVVVVQRYIGREDTTRPKEPVL